MKIMVDMDGWKKKLVENGHFSDGDLKPEGQKPLLLCIKAESWTKHDFNGAIKGRILEWHKIILSLFVI